MACFEPSCKKLISLQRVIQDPSGAYHSNSLPLKQAEKNELREEKVVLKEDKERIEQQLKAMTVSPPGFLPSPHPAAYHAAANKMAVFPSYGYVPMWQYLPPNVLDTTQDRELRPPAA